MKNIDVEAYYDGDDIELELAYDRPFSELLSALAARFAEIVDD